MGKRSRDISFSPSGDESPADSPFTSEVDDNPSPKVMAFDNSEMVDHRTLMQCSLPPHTSSLEFRSPEEFEVHYAKEHTNRCSSCAKNFPSAHFLNLHIDEVHNPVREALAAKGERTYACFVEGCERMCSTPQKRKFHLMDKHAFPKVYNFRIVITGIDNTLSLLQHNRRRRVSTSNDAHFRTQRATSIVAQSKASARNPMTKIPEHKSAKAHVEPDSINRSDTTEVSTAKHDSKDPMQDLQNSFSALQFVPRSVASKRAQLSADR